MSRTFKFDYGRRFWRHATPLFVLSLCFCGCFARPEGTRFNRYLDQWEIHKMKVSLRGPKQSICPGEKVQMLAKLDATKKRRSNRARVLETPGEGSGGFRKVSFENFHFRSEQGRFDKEGFFSALEDPLQSVNGFYIATKFESEEQAKASKDHFKVDYSCVTSGGTSGATGSTGIARQRRRDGQGAPEASSGGAGEDGGHVVAYATRVQSKLHDDLVALRFGDSARYTQIFHISRGYRVYARGGAGGTGGQGATGQSGADGTKTSRPGDGQDGGHGGHGGNGGRGGSIEFYYDERYPELAHAVTLDVSGGRGGAGGEGGEGGKGGKPYTPEVSKEDKAKGVKAPRSNQRAGRAGTSGQRGLSGRNGEDGEAIASAIPFGELFADLEYVEGLSWERPELAPVETSPSTEQQPAANPEVAPTPASETSSGAAQDAHEAESSSVMPPNATNSSSTQTQVAPATQNNIEGSTEPGKDTKLSEPSDATKKEKAE